MVGRLATPDGPCQAPGGPRVYDRGRRQHPPGRQPLLQPSSPQHVTSPTARPPARPDPPAALTGLALRRRVDTLVGLLGDESNAVHEVVRDELLRLGRPARPILRRAAKAQPPRLRARARTILGELDRRAVVRRLLRRATKRRIDLERALFLLGRLDRPALDSRPYARALDAMGAEVQRRVSRESNPLSRSMVLAQYLGNELGFIGSEVDYEHPDNVHLHRAIERKRGMPLTLTAIYLFVARRAGVEAAALPLPGHVLLRVRDGRHGLVIDPFHGGKVRTREDCVRYLAEHSLAPRTEWFEEASDRALLQRHVLNLMNSFQVRGFSRAASDLHRVAMVLNREAQRDPVGRPS